MQYFVLIKEDFKTEWLILIACMALAFVFVTVRDSKRNKFAAICLSAVTLLFMLLLSFGMYPVLSKPLFKPRAMYGFGVFVTLIGIVLSTSAKIYFGKFACLILSWCFLVFSFTYGNALKVQEDYSRFRIEAVLYDLNDIDFMITQKERKAEVIVQFANSIGYAPAIKHMPKDYRMLKSLMPAKSSWTNGVYQFFNYYNLKNVSWNKPGKSGIDLSASDLPVLKDTAYHTIRGKDDCIFIEFK